MKKIVIYSTASCPYCIKAKQLLQDKGFAYEEIDVSANAELRTDMIKAAGGRRTVPQIFINDYHVGGFDDLYELNQQGKLENLLA